MLGTVSASRMDLITLDFAILTSLTASLGFLMRPSWWHCCRARFQRSRNRVVLCSGDIVHRDTEEGGVWKTEGLK